MTVAREHWGSRLGFIMASAGSAVGLGNVWKFPYMAGENGGGAFLIIYLGCVVFFGFALVMAELLIGRMTQSNPVGAFRKLGGRGWPMVGAMGVLTAFIILSFYIVVAGWTIAYMLFTVDGALSNPDAEALNAVFEQLTGSSWMPLLYAGLFMSLNVIVIIGGIGKGIERASKILMPLLLLILLALVARAVTLPGAAEGIEFFLVPDFSKVTGSTFTDAIGQAFFSLSLGMGAMLTYGSYMSKERNLPVDAAAVVTLDTFIAVLAGFMVLPAMFAAGMEPGSGGVGTTFKVLPAVFDAMPGGTLFGLGFFLLLGVAALTSSVSLLETVVCYFVDEHGASRRNATIGSAVVCFLLAIPASLSFGLLSDVTIFGMTFFALMDFLSFSITLPLGGLLTALCVGWVLGPRAVRAISNEGQISTPWAGLWLFMLRFVAPVGIGWILVQGLIG